MAIRPIDIARKLKLSTTTLRTYEELGLIPPVSRTASGYRIFTEEHIAYFICIRKMLAGFSLTRIAKILQTVMDKRIDAAFWMVTQAQAALHQERRISENLTRHLLQKNNSSINQKHRLLTINEVSRETGVPVTTIRYWDKVGLITVERGKENNYRLFTGDHIRQILTVYALKASVATNRHAYSVEQVKTALQEFDDTDSDRIITIANDIRQHIDTRNRAQIRGIAALYHLWMQVETDQFDDPQLDAQ